ncbi:MAG TPA: TIGR04283 family arsenosugar biosynthesis glycosyltransferase, partial [Candidatus Polarisedimenticolia bacterium]|nr:TIGR04283 family arsenosugar biosynthesis glycosyltransferase [Candidatus Polarisedimenticolia bacterium]
PPDGAAEDEYTPRLKIGQPPGRGWPAISIVLPAVNEEAALPGTLDAIARQREAPPFEVILADGGSIDRTVATFARLTRDWDSRRAAARVVVCDRAGRAVQMNAGAAAARGAVILFLHADTALPDGALRAVSQAMADDAVSGGGFALAFAEGGALLRLIAAWATWRSRLLRIHYGDQAPFVRRPVFDRIGGVPRMALFEDLELARAVKRAGRAVSLPLAVATSARRLREAGIARTALRFAWLKLRYALGGDPSSLRRDYPDIR